MLALAFVGAKYFCWPENRSGPSGTGNEQDHHLAILHHVYDVQRVVCSERQTQEAFCRTLMCKRAYLVNGKAPPTAAEACAATLPGQPDHLPSLLIGALLQHSRTCTQGRCVVGSVTYSLGGLLSTAASCQPQLLGSSMDGLSPVLCHLTLSNIMQDMSQLMCSLVSVSAVLHAVTCAASLGTLMRFNECGHLVLPGGQAVLLLERRVLAAKVLALQLDLGPLFERPPALHRRRQLLPVAAGDVGGLHALQIRAGVSQAEASETFEHDPFHHD